MLQRTTPATILALLTLTGGAAADTLIGDITWTAGSVINLDEDTRIQGDLMIEEGVTILIATGADVIVEAGGSLTVAGTADEPTVFTASGERWGTLVFQPGSMGTLERAVIERTADAGVRIEGASPAFIGCEIRDVRSSLSASTALTSPTAGEVINGGSAFGMHLTGGANPTIEATRIYDIEGGRGVSRTFRVTQPAASNGANGSSFDQNGGNGSPGALGLVAYNAGNGGVAAGLRVESGANATVRDSRIFEIRGGQGGSGGKGGSGGNGGRGGNGAAFVSVGRGGNGGLGGSGRPGGVGGHGGNALAIWATEPGSGLRIVQNLVHDITGGRGGIGGVGGSGGQGGSGGTGASTSLLFVCGGDGGNGASGGNAAPGGPSGDSGLAEALRVENAASRVFFVQNTVARVASSSPVGSAAAGARGARGFGGNAGSPGPGGCNGSAGSDGSLGNPSGSGLPGAFGPTSGLAADSPTSVIQIQATNNILSTGAPADAVAVFAAGSSIIASDSNCFDGWGSLTGGSGSGSLGFAFVVGDPMFADANANDFRPTAGSPVIDAGDSGQAAPFALTLDIAGRSRIVDDADTPNTGVGFEPIDMGAHEFGPDMPGCSAADLAAPFGTLNFFDVSAYIASYNAQDPAADLASPSGVWNFFDVSAFIAEYNAGCP